MIACPILIYDPALKLLAYSRMYPGLDDHIFQTAISNGYLDLETVKYFEKDKIFAQMDHSGSAVGEPDNFRMHADFAEPSTSVTNWRYTAFCCTPVSTHAATLTSSIRFFRNQH